MIEVNIRADDYATVLINFDGGARGNLMATQVWPGKKNWLEVDFVGDRASYHWEQPTPDKAWIGRRFDENGAVVRGTIGSNQGMSFIPPEHPIGYEGASANQFREFYQSIREGKRIGDYPMFERGHNATCSIDAVVRSRNSGVRETVNYHGL